LLQQRDDEHLPSKKVKIFYGGYFLLDLTFPPLGIYEKIELKLVDHIYYVKVLNFWSFFSSN